jgi:hypothetical protein
MTGMTKKRAAVGSRVRRRERKHCNHTHQVVLACNETETSENLTL